MTLNYHRTADINLIHKNTANTSSLTGRGRMMIFEPETCLYVCKFNSIHFNENLIWVFQNGGFFPIAFFFLVKLGFCKYQLILWPYICIFEKIFFHLKALQTRMWINENNFFGGQVVLEIYAKTQVSKTAWAQFILECI